MTFGRRALALAATAMLLSGSPGKLRHRFKVRRELAFSCASIEWMTVRDDAPPAIRNVATAELRALVTKRIASGSRVLVVPVLLSFGGIEQGVRKRLEGLDYTMAPQAVMPDDRLAEWIEAQVAR